MSMDELHRRLLKYHGHDRAMQQLRDLVRYGHELTEDERWLVEAALADAGRIPASPRGQWRETT